MNNDLRCCFQDVWAKALDELRRYGETIQKYYHPFVEDFFGVNDDEKRD